ncbi:MAG: tetratricopeptide repeat protein [Candidatus Latescibacteria bacterium]|nr:tetratricopeptide repeat protein [Candidatus Latescibacterota bacterium]
MPATLFPLEDRPRTWWGYGLLLTLVAAFTFAGLRDHLLDTHDADTFADHLRIQQDWHYFFSPEKTQASGRPVAEAAKYLAFLVWGNDAAAFHLLVIAAHTAASFLWALACRRLGLDLGLSLLAGLLFLVNVTHFQVLHHISALDYPLALCWMLVSLGCFAHARSGASPWWWAAFAAGVVLGLMTHLASGVVVPCCLYWSWREDGGWGGLGRRVLVVAALAIPVLLLLLRLTSAQTSTWRSLDLYRAQDPVTLVAGMARVLLWFVSRLWTTAHWLPLPAFRQEPWELYAGAVALAGLVWAVWRGPRALALGAVWIGCTLLPFLLLTETTIRDLPAGPSRYLYLASAGSSLWWAWGLQALGQRRDWGRLLAPGALVVVLISSWTNLRRAEAISFYTSGRNYLAHGQSAEGVGQLRRALDRAPRLLPLEEVYFRLACALPYGGEDPVPLLHQGLVEFPDSFLLNSAMAVVGSASPDLETRKHGEELLGHLAQQARAQGQAANFAGNVAAIYFNLGGGALGRRETLNAIRCFEGALQYVPGKHPAQHGLASAWALRGIELGEQGDEVRAREAYTRALEFDPGQNTARVNLGWNEYRSGHWDQAIAHFRAALASGPSVHAQFNLGLACLAKGDTAAARRAYGEAITQYGAATGEQIGAVRDLRALVAGGRAGEVAAEILGRYWPATSAPR